MAKSKTQKISPAEYRDLRGIQALGSFMPKAKAPRKDDEHKSQVAFFQEIALHYNKYEHWKSVYAIPNGARTSMKTAKRLKAEGLKAGTPDIVCPFSRSGYHALYVEMKTETNSPSAAQQAMIAMLIAQGNAVVVCRSSEEAMSVLMVYESGQLTEGMLYQKYKRRRSLV